MTPEENDRFHYLQALQLERLPPAIPVPQLARLLGIDRRRLYESVAAGRLHAIRSGKRGIRVLRESVREWLMRVE